MGLASGLIKNLTFVVFAPPYIVAAIGSVSTGSSSGTVSVPEHFVAFSLLSVFGLCHFLIFLVYIASIIFTVINPGEKYIISFGHLFLEQQF